MPAGGGLLAGPIYLLLIAKVHKRWSLSITVSYTHLDVYKRQELLDYAVLSEKAAAASAHFNELSARIKSAETRVAEIAVLREHIVGYAKTRCV